jgi:hypothetical protein
MVAKVQIEFEMKTEKCINCGVPFGLPDYFRNELLRSHHTFYCPNGHGQIYSGENKEEQLARELAESYKRLEFSRNEARSLKNQRDEMEAKLKTATASTKRLKTRIKNGVCPCCKRTFKQLARHIENKHPNYSEVSK